MMKLAYAALLAATVSAPVLAQTDPNAAATTAPDPSAATPQSTPAADASTSAAPDAATTATPSQGTGATSSGGSSSGSFMGLDTAVGSDASMPKTAIGGQAFTGLRGEVFGGWNRTNTKYHAGATSAIGSGKVRHDGVTAGVLLGYDYPIGSMLVVGPFASIAGTTGQQCNDRPAGALGCYRQQAEAEGGARVGARFGDRLLGYVKGAYMETLYSTTDYANPAGANNGHSWHHGWRAGAGAELAINNHLYTKIEYDYTRTSRFSGEPHGFADTDISSQRSSVLAGVGLRF